MWGTGQHWPWMVVISVINCHITNYLRISWHKAIIAFILFTIGASMGGLNEASSSLFHLHQCSGSKVGGCPYLKARSHVWSLMLATGWDSCWGCGQNSYIWPFLVAARLPQTLVPRFSGWEKRGNQGKAVAFFDRGLKLFRAHFYLVLFIRSKLQGERN